MIVNFLRAALLILASTLLPRAEASGDLRVAIVVGNAAYPAAPLRNPINDAGAMATALQKLGFRVIQVHDGRKAQIEAAIADASQLLMGRKGIGLLYFAGHGLQLEWRNYLLPIDAVPTSQSEVLAQTIDIHTVLDAFKAAGSRMNIIVLDACRNNPFGGSTAAKGLAPIDAPSGTFLAYATSPGNVAEDGTSESGNGIYTGFLVRELARGDARIEDVFKRVRFQVRQSTQGRQVPWESTSLEEDFAFASNELPSASPQDFRAEKAEWDRIRDSKNATDFYAYLQRFPSGFFAEHAQFRLDQLSSVAVIQATGPDGLRHLPSGVNRYRVGDLLVFDRIDREAGTTSRYRREVTAADDRVVVMNSGERVFDQMGGVIKTRGGLKEPAELRAPAELSIGRRWHSSFVLTPAQGGPTRRVSLAFRTVSIEQIEVPAGKFITYRVEARGNSIGAMDTIAIESTYWIDPKTMMIVREEARHRLGNKYLENAVDVLVSLHAPR